MRVAEILSDPSREAYFAQPGHDTWVDADGTIYAASLDVEDGTIRLERDEADLPRPARGLQRSLHPTDLQDVDLGRAQLERAPGTPARTPASSPAQEPAGSPSR